MHRLRLPLLASSLLWSGMARAADPPPQPAQPIASEHRLSPAEIEQVLADAARKREQGPPVAQAPELDDDKLPPPIHGEVGFAIGTGGYRSAFGTAIVPLPGDGFAAFSFESSRFNFRDYNRRAH